MSEPRTSRGSVAIALGSSLATHLVVIGVLALVKSPRSGSSRFDTLVEYLSPHLDLEIIEDPDPEYEPPDEAPADHVVHAPETGEEGTPDEPPRYAAARSTFTKHETRARIRVVSPDRVPDAEPAAPGDSDQGELEPAPPPPAGGRTGLRLHDPAPTSDGPVGTGGLFAMHVPALGTGRDRGSRGGPDLGGGGTEGPPGPPGPGPTLERVRPTLGDLRDAIRGTGLENLEDVDEGERTALNAVEWRHAPFFNRVQEQVEQFWRPGDEYGEHDPTGNIYGYRDRQTIIKVVLNRDGSLRNAYVIEESGAGFLDDEAREAIEQAAPFPRPPQGLVDPETSVVAFRFSFTVQVHEAPVVRIQRYGE
ncbi:MAG: TonB C-terminal domain-containing protein [Deltaproteobacteria bacterium]|nr:TonB C-terminal domain-containing protein [Deltaproteobacteria bacterium]